MNFGKNQIYGQTASSFINKVYAWICVGLAVTAGVAYYLSPNMNPQLMQTVSVGFLPVILLLIAQMGIIFYLSANIMNISPVTAIVLYIAFATLMGISIAPVQYVYTDASIFNMFIVTALMFIVMALYGWLTKSDLSSMHNILFMGLIGLMIGGLVNMFMHSSVLSLIVSACGVGIFALLIAYDVQKLKQLSQQALMNEEESTKFAIFGALQLYLNVINLFLYLLQLFGDRRKE